MAKSPVKNEGEPMPHYFFRKDYQALSDQIEKLKGDVRSTHKETAESATQSSETWHDNFGFEEGQRRLKMLMKRIGELEAILRNASIVEPEARDGKVKLGSDIAIIDVETGEERAYRISSYMTFTDDKSAISYDSPIARLLMGAVEGDIREGSVGTKNRLLKVVRVT